jgi:[acyl-carrier-protein] S-malonyltransferase
MVTGTFAYEGHNVREILHRWVDHPQLLWDVVFEILSLGLETVIHVGPKPNIIPATFRRLSENVELQTRGKLHMRALGRMARTSWLSAMLPQKAALLRAPFVKQIVLEDWLLAAKPSPGQ